MDQIKAKIFLGQPKPNLRIKLNPNQTKPNKFRTKMKEMQINQNIVPFREHHLQGIISTKTINIQKNRAGIQYYQPHYPT